MQYILSYDKANTHLIDLEFIISDINSEKIEVQLPAWRPGRYELGNFAKNIQKWEAFDEQGNILISKKVTKDKWEIQTSGVSKIHIRYNYYAYQLDAGACWLDDSQLYVNGVHCFLYVPGRENEQYIVELQIPEKYQVATGLKKQSENILIADSFDQLVDSPFIASKTLKHNSYQIDGVEFHLWFQGECKPDWERILKDFTAFTKEQMDMMGDFPAKEYHYLIQILPFRFYHGVEHLNSTVIALGPGYSLMKPEIYQDFLGVNSHELFHSWNIKAIRPIEMFPYDFTKENYSRLGYVAEGVTTYYGDLFLARSGVFSTKDYFDEIDARFKKHFDNFGRMSMSVANASFDTWLDGYVPGIPNRKTSIYDEGSICALMIDLLIRQNTNNQKSLDNVMHRLYHDFAKKNKGYSEEDYLGLIEDVANSSFKDFFRDYIYGTKNFEPKLKDVLNIVGCELTKTPSKNHCENHFGFKIIQEGGITKVSVVAPNSQAEQVGLAKDDEIFSINGLKLENNLNDWCTYFQGEEICLSTFSQRKEKIIRLRPEKEVYFMTYNISKQKNASPEQKEAFKAWLKKDFTDQ